MPLNGKFEGLSWVKKQAKGKVSDDVSGQGHIGVARMGIYRRRG